MIHKLQALEQKFGKWIPFALAILFFVINLIVFTDKDLKHDEPASVYRAMKPFAEMMSELFMGSPGILFEVFLRLWIKIGGIGLEWMRILPLIFSTVGIFFLYKIAMRLGGVVSATIAVFMYAFSSLMHYYSFELRPYSLYATLCLASTWLVLKFSDEQNTPRQTTCYYWIWGFVNLCLVCVHWFAWFFVGYQVLLTFLYFKKQRKKIAYISGFLLLFIIPLAFRIFGRFTHAISGGTSFLTSPKITDIFAFTKTFFNDMNRVSVVVLLLCLAAAFLIAIEKKEKKFQFLCLSFFLPFVTMFVISFKYPMWVPRYVIYACVGLILICSLSFSGFFCLLKRRASKILWIIFSTFLLGYYTYSFTADHRAYYHFDYSGAVEYARKYEKKSRVIAVTNWDAAFMYAYHRPIFCKAVEGNAFGKYEDFSFLPLWNGSQLQTIREKDCEQVIVFGNAFSAEDVKPLLDSLATMYPYQSEAVFFEPFNHVKIYQKQAFSQE